MNKIEIYPKVIVYKNMLPRWKEYVELLKESEKEALNIYLKNGKIGMALEA